MPAPTKYYLVADSRNRYLATSGDIFIQDMQVACRFLDKVAAQSVVDRFPNINLTVVEVSADPRTGQLDKVTDNVDEQKSPTFSIPEIEKTSDGGK